MTRHGSFDRPDHREPHRAAREVIALLTTDLPAPGAPAPS